MATYDNTKFYWLQLKEDFFDEDSIDWLEEQPNGKEYSLFYLKLCLKSLRTNGVLIRRVGNMLVPYDHTKLGELTKTKPDTVMVAMQLLTKIGLVKMLENGELYITQVEHMIGSQSKGAFKKQQQRLTRNNVELIEGGQEGDNCPPDKEEEEEQELKLEEDLEKNKKKESKKKPSGYDEIISNNISNNEVIETLQEFIKMRKLIKKPLTDYALKMLINKLKGLSNDPDIQVKILQQSIIHNWQGIFELKEDNQQAKKEVKSSFADVAEHIRNNDDTTEEIDRSNLNF